jgi:hypothetical protein
LPIDPGFQRSGRMPGVCWREALKLTPRDVGTSNAAGNAFGPLKFDAYCRLQTNAAGKTMSRSNQLQIDSLHARAICDEIGERLRMMLRPETADLPVGLQILIARLADQDREPAPSIVPDLDDMIRQPVAASRAA